MKELLKVILVDDEYLIRNLIRVRINWKDNGLEIVGEAANAKEAMELLDKFNPDIVFTDICMPNTDGIDLSKIILKKYPHMKVVIITGYDEFEYAQKAIKIGISDYILKPIRAEELLATIERLKDSIQKNPTAFLKNNIENINEDDVLRITKSAALSKKAIKYIQENFHNPNLSIRDTASNFHLSSGHLGRIIKQETGETFVGYLTNIRIQRAKELLINTDLTSYLIGERVGITDPHYFSILFKKTTGISVSSFRKIHTKSKEC